MFTTMVCSAYRRKTWLWEKSNREDFTTTLAIGLYYSLFTMMVRALTGPLL